MRDWKLVVGGAGLALLLLGGCTTALTTADQAKLDEAIAASEKAADAAASAEASAMKVMDAVQKAEAAAMKAEEAAAQAQMNADLSKKAFETGLKK
ncbi:MAG: hypothetical protein JXK94_02225 [Deltaproteobacteria bacterium]|nr:hypothetical protein [Deltaproteobacteria bacterium]